MHKGIILTILVLLLIFGGWFWWKYYFTYSDGNRTGLLQKFSRKGNAFKTYEGELVLNSLTANGQNSFSAEKFYFSVADEGVAKKMSGYEGQKVILHYQEKKGVLFWRGDTKYIVDSVNQLGQ
ncbi:MAG: hypothetical protein JWQ96_417 [Segetibacter sp.]|nr:hypothetical protein [Segetibacter sp.]